MEGPDHDPPNDLDPQLAPRPNPDPWVEGLLVEREEGLALIEARAAALANNPPILYPEIPHTGPHGANYLQIPIGVTTAADFSIPAVTRTAAVLGLEARSEDDQRHEQDLVVEARTRAILAMTGRDGTIDPEAVERRYLPRPRTAAEVAFRDFGKIPRLGTMTAVLTEKVDGTNAQIYVHPDGTVRAASRNRWITPEDDNYGFAAWVAEHAEVLRRLGPGRHYGEWYGAVLSLGEGPARWKAIGRGYGLQETRLALFSARWREKGLPEGLPANVHPVREVYRGGWFGVAEAIANLYATGSITVPGWRKPEGAVVELGGQRWKVTDLAPGSKPRE